MSIQTLGKKFAATLQAMVLMFGIGSAGLAAVTITTVGTAAPAYADCTGNPNTSADPLSDGALCSKSKSAKDNLFGTGGVFQTVANTLIFLVGAIAVLFLILGGLRYVISNGDPKNVEAAKSTILYAVIGIVVAILSFAAVQFVISSIGNGSAGGA